MWLLNKLVPVWHFNLPFSEEISTFFLCAGFLITFFGIWSFRQASTTVDPLHPEQASNLVTSGVYKYTRNPMYLGMLMVLLSWMVYLENSINILIAIVFVWFISRYQILPEEKVLKALFGEQYDNYCIRTRRWI